MKIKSIKTLEDLKNRDDVSIYNLRHEVKKLIQKIKEDFKLTNKDIPTNIFIDKSGFLAYEVPSDLTEQEKLKGISAIAWFKYFFNIEEIK